MNRLFTELDSAQSRLHGLAFGILMAVAVGLRLIAFTGYEGSDSRGYALLADDLANGTLHIPGYDGAASFPLRLGFYAPVALIIRLFGLSEATLVAYPFAISLLGCVLTYGLARYLASPLAALVALATLAIVPLDVFMASRLMPDSIAAFWANAGLASIFVAMGKATTRLHLVLLGFAGGVLLGVSWLCKESVLYLFPFLAILFLWIYRERGWGSRITCMATVAAGFTVVVAAEVALYWSLTGDPLFRFHEMERNFKQCAIFFFDVASPDSGVKEQGYARALINRLAVQGPKSILFLRSMALAPTFAILGAVWMRMFLPRGSVIPTAWLFSLLCMFNFMTSSFSTYRPLTLYDRYLYSMLMPSTILIGSFIACLVKGENDSRLDRERRFWAALLLFGFFAISMYCVRSFVKAPVMKVERRVAKQLQADDVIYSDQETTANIVFFRTKSLASADDFGIAWEGKSEADLQHGSYVLMRGDRMAFLKKYYDYAVPQFVENPPATWKLLWKDGEAALFRIESSVEPSR